MRATALYCPTLRQAPAEAETPGLQLLLRAGYLRQLGPGAACFLPLGLRVLRKAEALLREEWEAVGAQEVLLPLLQPRELWERGGRLSPVAAEAWRTKDAAGREYLLGPGHEAPATALAAADVSSYKQLPLTLYHVGQATGDGSRTGGGLLRARDTVTAEAYCFDGGEAAAERSYEQMVSACGRLLARLGLKALRVEVAVSGGGTAEALMVQSPVGETAVLRCASCGYAADTACALSRPPLPLPREGVAAAPQVVSTPEARTVEVVTEMLGVPAQALIKTLLFRGDTGFVAALVRGDRTLSEHKLAQVAGEALRLAEPEEIRALTGAEVGFSGPLGLQGKARVIADYEVAAMPEAVVGANRTDAHLTGVVPGQHFTPDEYADLRLVGASEPCPTCGGTLETVPGLVIGRLGTRGAGPSAPQFQDETGRLEPLRVACYTVDLSRCVAAVAEQAHDEGGLLWPSALAPFTAAVLLLDPATPEAAQHAERLYGQLQAAGLEVLLDDRQERPGVKFKEADLIGYPIVLVVGKRTVAEGTVEVRRRCDGAERVVPADEALNAARELLAEA